MIKNIFILRHAESEGNINRKAYSERPDYAIRLTDKGLAHAKQTGEKLAEVPGNFYMISSPYFRARQTADAIRGAIGERVGAYVESPLIREQEWNKGAPLMFDPEQESERVDIGSFYYRFNGGESCADVYKRIVLFHDKLVRPIMPEKIDNLIIVTHGMTLRVYLKYFFGWSVEQFEMMRNPKNCQIFHIERNTKTHEYELKTEPNWRKKLTSVFPYDKNDVYITQNDKDN